MSDERTDVTRGRVLGPIAVVFIFLVLIVVSRVTSTDEASVSTTFAFANTTSPTAPTTADPPTDTTTSATASAPGWIPLDAGELAPRGGSAMVLAGDRVVVWGGIGRPGAEYLSDGASYLDGVWTPMADSPIIGGVVSVAVMTGRELFVYSGAAAAWNPSDNTWRTLPDPSTGPAGGGGPFAGVWADTKVMLVGYRTYPPTREDNLFVTAYGPDLSCCETYPDPPFNLSYGDAFWTGEEMLLIGGLLEPGELPFRGEGEPHFGSLDPVTETWTVHDPPPLQDSAPVATTWTGSALIAVDASGSAARWTPAAGWEPLPQVQKAGLDCAWRLTSVDGRVVAITCSQATVWDEAAGRWYTIASPRNVRWHSDICQSVPGAEGRLDVYLVCSGDLIGNQFFRIDLSAVEATRHSEPATPSRWELLPNPAATRLESTTMVWNGEELLYFSGHGIEVEESGGWGYDPTANIMHRIPDAPYPGRFGQVALWTGDEMLIQRGPTTLWNPITLEWRTAEQSPALGASPFAVWAGEEVIFYGSRSAPSNSGAVYSPKTDTWRPIATGPTAAAVGIQVMASSGDTVYAFGNWSGFDDSQSGAVYDAETDRWRPLPPIPEEFAFSGSVGDFVDGEFIIVGENWDPLLTEGAPLIAGLAYSPESDTWRTIVRLRTTDALPRAGGHPTTVFNRSMAAVGHGDELAVFLPAGYSTDTASIAFYNPATDTWRYVEGAPADALGPILVSGDTFVAYLTYAGTVLLHDG